MEENKNNYCCMWKRCNVMKHVVWVILIVISFYLGSQIGELKSEILGTCGSYRHTMNNYNREEKPFVQQDNNQTQIPAQTVKTEAKQ